MVEYQTSTKTYSTRVEAFCERFALDAEKTQMLSIFGNDAEIAAISAAISTNASLTAKLPDGTYKTLSLGDHVTNYRGTIQLPGRQRPLRHLLSLSQELMQNGLDGKVFLLNNDHSLLWATVISLMGLPATPDWTGPGVDFLYCSGMVEELQGFNCSPIAIKLNREDLLHWIGDQVRCGALAFPSQQGPIRWPRYTTEYLIRSPEEELNIAA